MAIDIRVKLGRRLQQLRTERGWSQAYLAEISGINRSHISELENGIRDIRLTSLQILATCFKMTLTEMFRDL